MENYFNDYVVGMAAAGNALPVATDATTNVLITPQGTLYATNINAQTLLAPVSAATGLNVSGDATAGDGFDITLQYPGATNAAAKFIFGAIGTEKLGFFVEVKATLQDVSGIGELFVGFRKNEAYAAARASYTDYVGVLVDGTKIEAATQVATGGETVTDSGKVVADGAALVMRVEVDYNGVASCFTNYNNTTGLLTTDGTVYKVAKVPPYTFTSGLSVVPFIRFIQDTDISTMTINYVKCGYLN